VYVCMCVCVCELSRPLAISQVGGRGTEWGGERCDLELVPAWASTTHWL